MLIRILEELLAPDDPRWTTFGLNMPAADVTPAAPTNLTANIADGPVLLASCDATPLATRYRWRIKVVGVDAEFRLAASTKSSLAQLDKVLPGQSVKMASNESGETVSGYTSTQTSAGNGSASESNGETRRARNLETNGARH